MLHRRLIFRLGGLYIRSATLAPRKPYLLSLAVTPRPLPSSRLWASQSQDLDAATYDRVCLETLDALSDYFEELTENAPDLPGSDVAYSDGVLTVKLGSSLGTYVINRQTPNKQIWLSSPTSGPKRFDFLDGKWIYKHSGETLHQLLQLELGQIIKSQSSLDFKQLAYGS